MTPILPTDEKSTAANESPNALMYPYAILPDSILFLMDDLLSANPQYATALLSCAADFDEKDSTAEAGLIWPAHDRSVQFANSPSCFNYRGTLLQYMMRSIFPKLIVLASPNCCAASEWKEVLRGSLPATGSGSAGVDSGELDALMGAATLGGRKPAFDTLIHFVTKLLKTACNGNAGKCGSLFVWSDSVSNGWSLYFVRLCL